MAKMRMSIFSTAIAVFLTLPAHAQDATRANFRASLEREFLSNGYSVDVRIGGTGFSDIIPGARSPETLIIIGWLTKARVFSAAWSGEVLQDAKAAGFRAVKFIDRGNEGIWSFDVSKGVPACEARQRVCR